MHFIIKQYQSWFTKKNYFILSFFALVIISLSRDIENFNLCLGIYVTIIGFYLFDLKKSWIFFLLVLIFLTLFLLFYKFDLSSIFNYNFYRVSEVKENYILVRKLGSLYYIAIGDSDLMVGEYIKLRGDFKKVIVDGNFWEFDFNSYLLNKNVKAKIIDTKFEKLNIFSVQYFLFKIINSSNDLSKLLFFQQKTNDIIYDNFNSYGLGYLLNFSGLNIYIISRFLNKKLFFNNKTYKKYRIFLILFLFYYSFLLGFKLFLIKATLFLFLKWIEDNWQIKFSKYTVLSIVWITCLFINPLFIFNTSFVFSIIAFSFLKKYNDKKPLTNFIYNFLIINSVFLPIQIFYDYKIYWFSSLFEIFLIPIITFCFIISFFFVLPFSNYILNFFYNLLFYYSKSFTYLNLTTVCGSYNFWFLIIYFFIFKFLTSWDYKKIKIKKIIIFIFSLNCFWIIQANQFTKLKPTITMLNVGNGNSFILHYYGKTILMDAGRGSGFSKNSLKQYLLYSGVRKIDTIFVSHNHQDHYDQIESLQEFYKIKNIYYNYDTEKYYSYKKLKITNFIENNNEDENDNSQISFIEINDKSILFMGDATKKRELKLIEDENFLKKIKKGVNLLQVGHHGSKTSTSDIFISKVKPKTCYISGHKSKNFDFPNTEVIETLKKYSCETYITGGKNSFEYNINSEKTSIIQKNSF